MKKPSKIVMLLCLTGTFVLSFQSAINSEAESLVQNKTSNVLVVPTESILPKTGDRKIVISRSEQDIIESMAKTIPSFGNDVTFISQGQGKGYYLIKE